MSIGPPVSLREVTDEDVEVFYRQQADSAASDMAAFPSRDRAAHFAQWDVQRSGESSVVRTIDADGAVAGNIVSWVQDGRREVGYWIGRRYWGRGIATDALGQFTAMIAERPLFAHVADKNAASRRVLDKCGFVETGEAVEAGEVRLLLYVLRAEGD